MTADEAAGYIDRARQVQKRWVALSVRERVQTLRTLRWEVASRIDEIVDTISSEVGKPAMDALSGDVLVTLEQLKTYETMAQRVLRPTKVRKPPFFFHGAHFQEYRDPHGVVLVFAPWNYPLQLALVPAATALFAGNAVVLKCSEHTPRTAQLIEAICSSAGLPQDLLQISYASASQAEALVEARPDFVFFTGSTRGGQGVMNKAAARLIPTLLELGGKDAALIFANCDIERTAAGVCYAAFANSGQVCVSAKRLYVQRSIYNQFLALFLEEVERLRCGTSTDAEYGPLRVDGVQDHLESQLEDAIAKGARVHTKIEPGRPMVLSGVAPNARLLQDESFGPVVCIESFDDESEAIDLANSSEFALSATVWTGDIVQGERVAAALCCGTCAVNDAIRHVGNPYASFGGNKASGMGRYRGAEGLRAFTRTKTTMVAKPTRRKMHWFPHTATAFHQLELLLRLRHARHSPTSLLRWLRRLLPLAICALAAGQASGSDLKLNVKLPAHAHGKLAYLLFDSSAGFPDRHNQAIKHGFLDVTPGALTQSIDVGNVPPGRYALTAYLDENGNGKLDKNWLGIPKEPAGASNNPQPHMGPPRFEECAFTHSEAAQTIFINLLECCKR